MKRTLEAGIVVKDKEAALSNIPTKNHKKSWENALRGSRLKSSTRKGAVFILVQILIRKYIWLKDCA